MEDKTKTLCETFDYDEREIPDTNDSTESVSSKTYITDISLDSTASYSKQNGEDDACNTLEEHNDGLTKDWGDFKCQPEEGVENPNVIGVRRDGERYCFRQASSGIPNHTMLSDKMSEDSGLSKNYFSSIEQEEAKDMNARNKLDRDDGDVCTWERTLFDDHYESIECDMCSVRGHFSLGSMYCFDCEIYLCETCQKWHQKLQSSRDHFCMGKSEILGQKQGQPAQIAAQAETSAEKTRKQNPQKGQLSDPRKYRLEEVTIDRKSVCGPCLYGGMQEKAYGVCLECIEYLCRRHALMCESLVCPSACTSAHLAVSSHRIIECSEMEKGITKQIVPVYEEESYKEFFERTTPQKGTTHAQTLDKKISHVTSFSIRIFEDLQYPSVTGLAFTWDSRLLVCDRNNERLKLFSEECTPLSSLNVADLADVAVIDKITAVCTLPVKQKLAFVDLRKELKLLKFADTTVKYWGIEYLNHELFALTIPDKDSPACVHILDTTGHVTSMIYPQHSLTDKAITRYPKYLAVSPSGGTVYVTDKDNKVIALGLDGRTVFQYDTQEMRNASGLVTDARNVYVCLEGASCLVQVSLDGSDSSTALGHTNNLDRPCCVAMDAKIKRLVISELHTSIIQVFKT